jgi:hypothetical protein
MKIFNRPPRDVLLFLLLVAAAWRCIEKELQWAFLFCAAAACAIVFKHKAATLEQLSTRWARDTHEGKLGSFEFKRRRPIDGLAGPLALRDPTLAHILAALDPQELALLILVVRERSLTSKSGQVAAWRALRSHGLVVSDGSIGGGGSISPTKLGEELVTALLNVGQEIQGNSFEFEVRQREGGGS